VPDNTPAAGYGELIPADPVAAALDDMQKRYDVFRESDGMPLLLGALRAVLELHKIEPLYAHSDDGECGCPGPTEHSSAAHDLWYEGGHPEGHGPDGFGIICKNKTVGHWCRGCANTAVEHGYFEVPRDYPPEKCALRAAISGELLGEGSGNE
jgi:hypothetical protein